MGISVAEFNRMRAQANASANTRVHREQPEHELQVECLHWFYSTFPMFEPLIWATPNAARRTERIAAIMKAEGMKAGVPDLFLAVARKGHHGLFIEMKNGKKGRLSEPQKDMLARLSDQGYLCAVCRDLEGFKKTIKQYLCV